MKVPQCEHAVIPERKITGYLLAAAQEVGGGKPAFFTGVGFSREPWEQLAAALLRHVVEHDVARIVEKPYGTLYAVEGTMDTPDERSPLVRSVWLIEAGHTGPRFITAYPLRRRSR